EIGRGGMGVVYRGHDLSLGRMVAIKVLPEQFNTDDEVIARFKKEARAMAALDHPNIVPVYAIGQQRNFHYFVMKFLEGATVAELLEEKRRQDPDGRFDPREVQSIIAQACRGLGHAHRRGLVHRDIKPGNLMVSPEHHVTIMDFGIVKETQALDRAEPSSQPLTRTGLVFGTPEYMAPEQAKGAVAPGPQADLYSLGVVAYEMLTGKPPFSGDSPFSVVLKHIKNPPAPLVEQVDGLSIEFQRAVFLALEKQVEDRYGDADEMATALLAHDPVTGARRSVPPGLAASAPPLAMRPPPRIATLEDEPAPLYRGRASVDELPPPPSQEPRGAGWAVTGPPPVVSPPPRVLDTTPGQVVPTGPLPPLAPRPHVPVKRAGPMHAPTGSLLGGESEVRAVNPSDVAVLEDRPGHYRDLVTARNREYEARRAKKRRRLMLAGGAVLILSALAALLLR
ncbi:MAG: protein kinase, partial [Myxococcales bacterium]|nr:protein kinase [Myxococcales bacterium]